MNLGNGRLKGFGPQPGTANLEERFVFDRRDRLTTYQGAGAAYDYHADGMLSSASTGADTLRFYYDAGKDAGVSNIHQPGADLWSAYLHGVRYLSDGSEEILLAPRKDTAGTYHPEAGTLQTYGYDAFGSQSDAATQSDYDLRDNPFQYAGQYRDPVLPAGALVSPGPAGLFVPRPAPQPQLLRLRRRQPVHAHRSRRHELQALVAQTYQQGGM